MNDMEEKALTPAEPYQNADQASEQAPPSAPGGDAPDKTMPPPPLPPHPVPPVYRPVRRVGTITMGLSLIAAGILILCGLLIPNFNIITAAKFAPLILIFLGFEILLRYFTAKGEKLKYDFLSGFICFLLIVASIAASTLPPLFRYYGPQHYIAESRMEQLLYDDVCSSLKGNGDVSSVQINVSLIDGQALDFQVEQMTDEQLKCLSYADARVYFSLIDKFEDTKAFATACKKILSSVNKLDYPLRNLRFSNSSYFLEVSAALADSISSENLALQVEDEKAHDAELETMYQMGYDTGLEEGHASGYNQGYEEGIQEEHDTAYQEGYDQGYSAAYSELHVS